LKNLFSALCVLTIVLAAAAQAEHIPLSLDWRFQKSDVADNKTFELDDSDWRKVNLPHDFSIEDDAKGATPFDPNTAGGHDSGYIPGGTGWYRRHLALDATTAKKVIFLEFEAVYMDADIWVNGEHIAKHHYGYTAFDVDLTNKVREGDNVIAVRINHEDSSSRWYAGSGIIRPVVLKIYPAIHIDKDGPFIKTPIATSKKGEVRVSTSLVNTRSSTQVATLTTSVLDRQGKSVKKIKTRISLGANASQTVEQTLSISNPKLWNTETPYLYKLSQALNFGEKEADQRDTHFGIRTISADTTNGLRINGERVLLRGGNIHHDNYMLGGAGIPRAEERKLEWMKNAGYNAVRSAHNPLSQASLDAADRLGLLVINEAFDAWEVPKRPKDYARFFTTDWQQDIRSMIVSGRNHPSVIMWSIGNELLEEDQPRGAEVSAMLVNAVHNLDDTRPVTLAIAKHNDQVQQFMAPLDIAGYNYHYKHYEPDHQKYPKRLMYASESFSSKVFESWEPTKTMPWVLGDFVWTAIDYLGEASIGGTGFTKDWKVIGPYPWHLAWCGEIDAIGRLRPNAYYRQIVWGNSPHKIAAFVRWPGPKYSIPDVREGGHLYWTSPDLHESWTWPGYEGKPVDVVVYSELPTVELFLNGQSLGKKSVGENDRKQVVFTVPYAAGALKAVGYEDGKPMAEWALTTVGAPVAIQLTADRNSITADGMDLAYFTAKLVDANGRVIYNEQDDKKLTFTVSGSGELAGAGNGKPYGTESFKSGIRTTFRGEAVAVVRSKTDIGSITVTVSAPGFATQQLTVNSNTDASQSVKKVH
jgi:beta-galactosidase